MTDRVLIQGGADACMRVSLPGYSVSSANIDQLAFDSRYSGLQIIKAGWCLADSGGTSVYYSEVQPTPPFVLAYFNQFGGTSPPYYGGAQNYIFGQINNSFQYRANNSFTTFIVKGFPAAFIRYVIFKRNLA